MGKIVAFGFLMAWAGNLEAQTINVHGKITNSSGQPVSNALVELTHSGVKDTTGADGMYALSKSGVALRAATANEGITLQHGMLRLTVTKITQVTVEVFDLHGNQLRLESLPNAGPGAYRWDFAGSPLSNQLMIIKASIGKDTRTFRYMPLQAANSGDGRAAAQFTPATNYLAKVAAVVDTLRVTASGYATKTITIGTLDTTADISLSAPSTAGGNSSGCGKTPTLKSGAALSFTPAGGSARTYNLRVPTDYANTTPYRLIVSLHWLNGTANNVSDGGGSTVKPYYGLWELANPTSGKSTTIFVAPQGIGNGWSNGSGSDVKFITALVQKLESEFCIDTTRVFAEGFSMGGSMSYALACGAPEMFRGVAVHSGGPMSGCDKANRKPVAYFMTHGINDNVCTYPGYGVPQINDFAQLNGCQTMDIAGTLKPTDQSGMSPKCADFQGCKTGYPARSCIFVGQHDPTPGKANSWVPGETWKFITQF